MASEMSSAIAPCELPTSTRYRTMPGSGAGKPLATRAASSRSAASAAPWLDSGLEVSADSSAASTGEVGRGARVSARSLARFVDPELAAGFVVPAEPGPFSLPLPLLWPLLLSFSLACFPSRGPRSGRSRCAR